MENSKVTLQQIEEAFNSAVKEDSLCPVGKLLASVPNDIHDVINSKVNDDLHYSAAVISRVLKGLGYPPISSHTISQHRKGACRCK